MIKIHCCLLFIIILPSIFIYYVITRHDTISINSYTPYVYNITFDTYNKARVEAWSSDFPFSVIIYNSATPHILFRNSDKYYYQINFLEFFENSTYDNFVIEFYGRYPCPNTTLNLLVNKYVSTPTYIHVKYVHPATSGKKYINDDDEFFWDDF